MIDAIEPPKLAGTERVSTDVPPETVTLDATVNDDGSITLVDTFTGEVETLPPDEETAAAMTINSGSGDSDATSAEAAAPDVDTSGTANTVDSPSPEPNPAPEEPGPITNSGPGPEGPKPASAKQRLALSKQIMALDEQLTNGFLDFCREHKIPFKPADMTFDEARRCLLLVGDRDNAKAE